MSTSKEFSDHQETDDPACASSPLDKATSAQSSPPGDVLDGEGSLVGGLPSPPSFVVRFCEVCDESFRAKRSDKKTCSVRCRKEKSRRTLDPERGSAARKQAQLDGLEKVHGGLRKAIIRDLAQRGLLLPSPRGNSEQDPTGFYTAEKRRLHAKRQPFFGDPTQDEVYRRLVYSLEQDRLARAERNRMLDQKIHSETEKLEATARRLDNAFSVSQREWLEMRARTITLSRLVLERYPDFPQCSELRSAAERVLALEDDLSVT
jgi:hypothetical protein